MTFGTAIQALDHLADHPGDEDDPEWRKLNGRAEERLLESSNRFIVGYGWVGDDKVKPLEPTSMITNMVYDPGKPERE